MPVPNIKQFIRYLLQKWDFSFYYSAYFLVGEVEGKFEESDVVAHSRESL